MVESFTLQGWKGDQLIAASSQWMAFVVEYMILPNLAAPFSTLEYLTN
jgi:hypothetical protein